MRSKNNSVSNKIMKVGKQKPHREQYEGSWFRHMYKALDILWGVMPTYLGTILGTLLVFVAGSSMRGDWIFILVHFIKHFKTNETEVPSTDPEESLQNVQEWSLAAFKLQGLPGFLLMDMLVSYAMYFTVCGFLQWYFYIRLRDKSEEWKCQPGKFLTPELERHEIVLGSLNVGFGGLLFGTIACYIYNGGTSKIYFQPDEYGYIWLALSVPIHFLYQDAAAYYIHRLMHIPFLYKNFHKWHHYYKQPTAFSASAMHPTEFVCFQVAMILPAFVVPIHALAYVGELMFIYYYGLINHSGIEMEPFWPWEPNVTFHDNHHQYFHVNFGFNLTLWDRLHGTMRKKDRVYNEDIYYGKGIALKDASAALKKEHAEEIAAEIVIKPKGQ